MNDIHFQHHVFIQKVCRSLLIGNNAPNLCRREEDIFRLLRCKERLYSRLHTQIQLLVCTGDDICVALPLKFPDDGGAYHAPMPGYVDFCVLIHDVSFAFLI